MKRRAFALALAALPGLVLAAGPAGRLPKNRLVFQVTEDDSRKWFAILGNIRNIQAELGKGNSAIAVVAIGPGLGMLNIESLAANEVQDAIKAGVEFVACENSMNAQHLGREDLIDGIGYAKAGYVELMKRQQQGWAYLRP
jgi:intracellular sulfur oxidation DsrE/DsrF family protein